MKALKFTGIIALLVVLASCVGTKDSGSKDEMADKDMSEKEMMSDIVDIAVSDGRFTTLVAALQAAELVETLQGDGPFTVFAPTDDAFAKLPEGTVEALLEDIPTLTNILLYHVVSGKVGSDAVVGLSSAETVEGSSITIEVKNGTVMLDDAKVIITDIKASNGIIHVIDSVLLP